MPVTRQLSILPTSVLSDWASEPGADYGEVFTRRWVVDLILDLIGYTPDKDLGAQTMIEPSCGTGAFLVPVVQRLIDSSENHGRSLGSLPTAIRAFDLLDANAERSRKAVATLLANRGMRTDSAEALVGEWITTGDFLLHSHQPARRGLCRW